VSFLKEKHSEEATEAKSKINYLGNSCKEAPSIKNGKNS
jgi:hypothetical protein